MQQFYSDGSTSSAVFSQAAFPYFALLGLVLADRMLLLFSLTLLIAYTSMSIAHHIYGRNEQALFTVGSGIAAHALVLVPLHVAGFTHLLTPGPVAVFVVIECGLVLGILVKKEGLGFLSLSRSIILRISRMGNNLKRALLHAGFPLWIGVGVALALWVWWGFATAFSPPRGNSDAFFYHEPIVGFLLQQHSFDVIDLPANLQRINGMPRFSHLTQLWFALFTGRTFVEWPAILSHLWAVAALYALMRRLQVQKSSALAWAFCFTLTPGVVRLTDGIMVDVHAAALTCAAVALVWVPKMRVSTVLLAGVAIGVLTGAKFNDLIIAFVLSISLIIRMVPLLRKLPTATAVFLFMGTAFPVVAALMVTLGRNYVLFQNPIFPAGLNIETLGIHWTAPSGMKSALSSGKGLSWQGVLDKFTEAPFRVRPWTNPSARVEDYGLAGVFLAWPLSFLSVLLMPLRAFRQKSQQAFKPSTLAAAWGVSILLVVVWALFPSFVRGRYYLCIVGLMYVMTAFLFAHPRRRVLGRQMAFMAQVMMLMSLVFVSKQGWITSPSAVWERLKTPAEERDFTRRALVTLRPKVGHARIKEMTAGKKLGFDSGKLLGVFWNDDYSNEVLWLGKGNALKLADQKNVDWLFLYRKPLNPKDALAYKWKLIGKTMGGRKGLPGHMYRRVVPANAHKKSAPRKRAPSSSGPAKPLKTTKQKEKAETVQQKPQTKAEAPKSLTAHPSQNNKSQNNKSQNNKEKIQLRRPQKLRKKTVPIFSMPKKLEKEKPGQKQAKPISAPEKTP